MWISKTPNGPSAKLHIQNIHTMDELKLTGNSLKGSRHVLSFDKNFDSSPHYQLLREMFTQVYGVPKGSRRSKPFIDHVLSFSIVDNKIWFRNYQVRMEEKSAIRTFHTQTNFFIGSLTDCRKEPCQHTWLYCQGQR
jgi:ribosome biogenesis protein BRX1